MINGIGIGIIEIGLYILISASIRKRFNVLNEINSITYYWLMMTILTGIWESSYILNFGSICNIAQDLINKNQHAWTNYYTLDYILPWNLAKIFYAEYGAYADREYMTTSDDWSRTIESSHALFCSVFSLLAIVYKIVSNGNEYLITLSIAMGSQFMNSLLYMANYFYQTHQKYSVNYDSPSFPCGPALTKRLFMWVNIFWLVFPAYTIAKYILDNQEKNLLYKYKSVTSIE